MFTGSPEVVRVVMSTPPVTCRELTDSTGKSVLMSTVIKELLDNHPAGTAVAFYYFRHSREVNNTARCSFENLLRSLLYQLIDQDRDLTDFITSKSRNDKLRLEDPDVLQDLVHKAAGTHKTLYLVLDGLDECQSDEEQDIIEWVLRLSQSVVGVRVLFAGQRDNVTDKLLSTQPSISLDKESEHHHDVEVYCQNFVGNIGSKFDATSAQEKAIVELVSKGAQGTLPSRPISRHNGHFADFHRIGMFLYARVVLDHLFRQRTPEELERELHPDVFPKNLSEA